MFSLKIFKGIFLGMLFLLALNANGVMAQDRCLFPTVTEEVNFPEGWYDFLSEPELSIICNADGKQLGFGSSCDAINRGAITHIRVTGDVDFPPYYWTITDPDGEIGWYIYEGGTPYKEYESDDATELITIYAGGGSCGAAKVTVIDAHGNFGTTYIRCADYGGWTNCHPTTCTNMGPCWPECNSWYPCSSTPCYIAGHQVTFIVDSEEGYVNGLCAECYCSRFGGDGWGMEFCPREMSDNPDSPCFGMLSHCPDNKYIEAIMIKYWECP